MEDDNGEIREKRQMLAVVLCTSCSSTWSTLRLHGAWRFEEVYVMSSNVEAGISEDAKMLKCMSNEPLVDLGSSYHSEQQSSDIYDIDSLVIWLYCLASLSIFDNITVLVSLIHNSVASMTILDEEINGNRENNICCICGLSFFCWNAYTS
jgi:hypothetical protein